MADRTFTIHDTTVMVWEESVDRAALANPSPPPFNDWRQPDA